MIWIKIVITLFVILETGNIMMLYFMPDFNMGNGMGAFKAWLKSKDDPKFHDLASYLVNWVAGTKLIFIGLLIVLLFTGDKLTLLIAAGVMALTISAFYWRMFPLIRKMDQEGEIEPAGYSKTLGWMILVFIVMFLVAILLALLT
jgi:hypothetical protein